MTAGAQRVRARGTRTPAQARASVARLILETGPFILAFAVYFAAFLVMRPEPTGDEPHYLISAESIAYDGDLDLENDFKSRWRVLRVASSFPLDTHWQAADYRGTGELRPIHAGALSVVLALPTRLGGLTGARLAMILIAALLADQLYRLLRDLKVREPWRFFAWVSVIFCLPVIAYSGQIYTELPGALLVVALVRLMIREPSPAVLAIGSTACAGLAWLHVRFLPLALAGMAGLWVAASLRRTDDEAGADRFGDSVLLLARRLLRTLREWRTVTVPLVVPFVVGLATLATAFNYWYGSFNPNAAYAIWVDVSVGGAGWNFIYEYVITDMFNPVQGWISFVPVQWLGLAGLGALIVRFGWPAAGVLAAVIGFELVGASAAPNAGWQFPARYLLIVIPLVAIPIAVVIQRHRLGQVLFVPLLGLSLVFAGAAVKDPEGLYPVGRKPRIFGASKTADLFPVTRDLNLARLATSFTLEPGQAKEKTGRVEDGMVVAREGRDRPDFVLWGPYSSLEEGTYTATFSLAATGAQSSDHVAAIEVAGVPPSTFFARREVTGAELGPRLRQKTLQFSTPGGYLVETRVYFLGHGILRAGPVVVRPVSLAERKLWGFPDWGLVLGWVGATLLVGAIFVTQARRSKRRPAS